MGVDIREAENSDIPNVASFLANTMYSGTVPVGQRKELTRLEQQDLVERYSEKLGKRVFPSVLLLLEVNNKLAGCVGLDCQYLDKQSRQLRKIQYYEEQNPQMEVAIVLANLAVSPDQRKKGYGRLLLKSCEAYAEEWGFKEIHLLVNADNTPAQKLYLSQGYKLLYTDNCGTFVASSPTGLKTQQCTNLCYVKKIGKRKESNNGFSGFIAKLFGEKDILESFSAFGHVTNVRIKRSSENKKHLLYGFVEYASAAEAVQAMQSMNG
eukprot:gene34798-42139_t